MKIFIFIVSAFFISSGLANIKKNYLFDNIWSSYAVEIEPFSYLYEYGSPNESKKIDRILSFPSSNIGSFYLDERILLQSNISKTDTRFLYKLGFDSICEAKFFDLRENEYRRFVLYPITTYNLNDVAYKRSSLISEDYGTISYSPNTISVNCIWIPFRGKINEFNLKRNLDLQLLDNSFIYTTRFKLSNNDKAIISSKYSLTTREYSFCELNLFTKKILYYFIKRYDVKEYKKFSMLVLITNVVLYMFLLSNAFMIPSIYDKTSSLYQSLVLDNLVMFITYPIAVIVTLYLGGYCFKTLKEEKEKKNIKIIATIVGLMFIDTFIFIYFSYAFLIRFDKAIIIAIENYFIKSIIMIIYVFIINKILSVKKVK